MGFNLLMCIVWLFVIDWHTLLHYISVVIVHTQVLEHGNTSQRWGASPIKRCRYDSLLFEIAFWAKGIVTTNVLQCPDFRKYHFMTNKMTGASAAAQRISQSFCCTVWVFLHMSSRLCNLQARYIFLSSINLSALQFVERKICDTQPPLSHSS